MNLAIGEHWRAYVPAPIRLPRSGSRIHVVHANPVVVPVNACTRDLVKLFQLLAADLAYLAIRHLDLTVVA